MQQHAIIARVPTVLQLSTAVTSFLLLRYLHTFEKFLNETNRVRKARKEISHDEYSSNLNPVINNYNDCVSFFLPARRAYETIISSARKKKFCLLIIQLLYYIFFDIYYVRRIISPRSVFVQAPSDDTCVCVYIYTF